MELRIAFFECEVLLLGTASTHGGRSSLREARESGKRDAREGSWKAKEVRRRDGAAREVRAAGRRPVWAAAERRREWARLGEGEREGLEERAIRRKDGLVEVEGTSC